MKRTVVVASIDELNFFVKRFAPRVQLRVSPDAVIAVAPQGELSVPPSITFKPEGRGEILGIGDEHAGEPDAVTVRLFTAAGLRSPDYQDLLDKFVRVLLRRLPRGGSFLRPVVIVDGLNSLPPDVAPRQREALARALANARAAAIVIEPVLG